MPSIKINNTNVEKIRLPQSGRVFYWDTELKGFAVKAQPSGLVYVVQRRIGGREGRIVKHIVGKDKEISAVEARKRAAAALATLRQGINLNEQKKQHQAKNAVNSLTLTQLFNAYISKRELRPRTKQTYEDALRLCVPDWCDRTITSISRDMIENRLQQIADEPGSRGNRKAQAAQCFTLLRALFRFAADRYEIAGVPLIKSMPTRNVARGKSWAKIEARDNIIAESDLPAWYQATGKIDDRVLKDYIQFLMFSGMRRTEALRLKWADINSKLLTITLAAENAKSGRKRIVPITPLLQQILEQRRAAQREAKDNVVKVCPYVFQGANPGTHLVEPRRALAIVRKETKIEFHFHDLRRSYITHAARLVPYPAVKALAGHSTGSSNDVTLRHYAKLDTQSLKQEALKVSTWFAEKCGIKQLASETIITSA